MRGARKPRRAVRFAAVAAVALLAGSLPGPDSAAGAPDGKVTLGYACRFPAGTGTDGAGTGTDSGTDSGTASASSDGAATAAGSGTPGGTGRAVVADATVTVVQNYPDTAVVGKPIQPGDPTVTLTLSHTAAAALLPAGAATLTGTASLTAHVSQGASRADAVWPSLTAPAAPADGDGDVVLTFGGPVPPVTVTAPGDVRFAAGELDLKLTPKAGAPSSPPDSPSPGAGGGTSTDAGTDTGAADAAGAGTQAATSADGTPSGTPTGAPAPLADLVGTCTPKPGQDDLLGAVPVAGAADGGATGPGHAAPPGAGSGSDSASGGATGTRAHTGTGAPATGTTGTRSAGGNTITLSSPPHSGVHDCEDPPKGDTDPAVMASIPRPSNAVRSPGPDDPPFPPYSQCGYVTGYSNVMKLHGAAVINDLTRKPTRVTVVQKSLWTEFTNPDPLQQYFEIDSIAKLALPPSETSFLTFGFMPVTARMELLPKGLMTVVTVGTSNLGTITTSTIYGKQELRLSDVKVNGVPLDVGRNCRASAPLDIKLVGYDRSSLTGRPTGPTDYGVQDGGPLAQDDLYIPPFTGCGSHGENLNSLFTSSISGHGNSLNLIQGPLCVPIAASGCDPEIAFPEPPHH
ncbi:DUF6801 domain-containing protein [Actinacidiphila alni]|uniref:DUF6801 domain-containing protein n=1 Tax=Actinacidiphila alni TaxID=380248 RepID=UPI0033C3DCD6